MLVKSDPAVPVKVRNTRCTPVAAALTDAVALCQDCQPPVGLTGTVAMTVPVVLSNRYWMVPLTVAPEAIRVVTVAGEPVP